MTTAADDSAVEDAFEALLAGRPAPGGAAGLAAFTGAVRASAARPGRPNAALAELLATGLLTDQSSPSVRTARSAGSPPVVRPSRVRIRRRTTMILPALIAKFLSAGAVAQAATGATVAVVAFTGVGAVGALPGPVQDTFSTVVAEVTPLEPPTSEEVVPEETVAEETVEEDAGTTEVTTGEVGAVDVAAWIETGPQGYDSFGAWVSASANDADLRAALRAEGQNFGSVISAWAKDKGYDEADLAAEGVDLDELTDAPAGSEAEVDAEEVAETEQTTTGQTRTGQTTTRQTKVATTEDRGSRGNSGNAGNRGGDSGKGNGNK